MQDSNLIKIIEEFSSTKVTKTELNSQLIKKKGLYELNNNAYFLLYPNYLDEDEKSKLSETSNNFEFKSLHKNRDTYYIGPEYRYSKIVHPTNDNWDKTILKTKAKLELMLESPFNSVLVNRYEVGQQIPFHKDNESCLKDKPVIASLSIGDTGKMTIKDEQNNFAEVIIYPGTLLVMFGNFNNNYFHQVERTTTNKKYRTNFTFRYVFSPDTKPTPNTTTPISTPHTSNSSELNNNKIILLKPKFTTESTDPSTNPPNTTNSEASSSSAITTAGSTPIPKSVPAVTDHLNMLLATKDKISESDIRIEDYTEKMGH